MDFSDKLDQLQQRAAEAKQAAQAKPASHAPPTRKSWGITAHSAGIRGSRIGWGPGVVAPGFLKLRLKRLFTTWRAV